MTPKHRNELPANGRLMFKGVIPEEQSWRVSMAEVWLMELGRLATHFP